VSGRASRVVVPYARLAPPLLRRLAEEFVTREGTDYGATEKTLDAKPSDVIGQLRCGAAVVVYDAQSGSTNIVPRRARLRDELCGARCQRSRKKGPPVVV